MTNEKFKLIHGVRPEDVHFKICQFDLLQSSAVFSEIKSVTGDNDRMIRDLLKVYDVERHTNKRIRVAQFMGKHIDKI